MASGEILLLKLGEVVLKGLNRRAFEERLLSNVRRRLRACGDFRVTMSQSTIYVEPQGECDVDEAFRAARQVFGIVTAARAKACAKDADAIAQTAIEYLREDLARAKTFKVESRRADKRFPMNSIQLSQYVGGKLAAAYPHLRAQMHEPDHTVFTEVRETAA
ncbi:MAG: tRNA 4-thiouridine(8) synthase ThiI, partial [Oscillibacter sp.]|nr:tRNA 4-thiouridine(8) synthase ThiI [Oscillibacter sp.]